MSQPQPIRMCLVGLPATGKTTYIAALWAFLRSGSPDSKYRVPTVPADTAYLNSIAKAWSDRAEMPRSSPGATDTVEFTIEIEGRDPVTVVLPDLPGEVFLNAIRRPSIDMLPADAVQSSDLILLFVNGQTATTFIPLGDQEPLNDAELDPDKPSAGETTKEFAVGDLDTDTLNTELLERLLYLLKDRRMPTIVVVISAWDVLESSYAAPDAWFEQQQPMTWQYLEGLRIQTTVGIIGVSAQGADYSDQPTVHHAPAADRAWGRADTDTRTDIAGPLLWFDTVTRASPDG